MDTQASGSTITGRSFEDFYPVAHWVKEEDNTLELHLHDFKKEQLRIQFSKPGNMKISGERPLVENNWSRFTMEFRIPKNIFVQAIQAKFVNGVLYVKLPKTITKNVIRKDITPINKRAQEEAHPTARTTSLRDKFSEEEGTLLGRIYSSTGFEDNKTSNQSREDASIIKVLQATTDEPKTSSGASMVNVLILTILVSFVAYAARMYTSKF
ncbi:hypothetical protein C5167_024047 [Papaver somniferum]|uniref:SHSP domain-containing protein n=1 Tax=Papaver somniferum TaxID=3469 RepID=A0A4Y7JMF6_PAPSO|nr:inactive protein RESTRICTED TEV MOVEMENT 2-like [Papaver somniferum]RZC62273.1 hypothetical protein C5167_024047 [Papaver somniferum]